MTKAWETQKPRMYELYMVRNMKLATLQRIMREDYSFVASERAYKQKFKEWRWFKKTPRNNGYAEPEVIHIDPILVGPGSQTESAFPSPDSNHPHIRHFAHESLDFPLDLSPTSVGDAECAGMVPDSRSGGGAWTQAYCPSPEDHHSAPNAFGSLIRSGGMHGRGGTNYNTSPPLISLPPVCDLDLAACKERVKEAQRQLDLGKLDSAQNALQNAIWSLQFVRR
ncbi:hypothetical protein RUND412_000998 [Rhizina undulata]